MMGVIYILLGISLVVASFFLGVFIYAVSKGQYDEIDTPAIQILEKDN